LRALSYPVLVAHSLAEQIALLSEEERNELLEGVDAEALLWDSNFWLRPEQMEPEPSDDWAIWLYMAGRGAGKTRAAAEWIRKRARNNDRKLRFGLVARTASDVRDVLVEGDSGILNVSPPSERPEYQPSRRRLVWPNGHTALCFSADEPDQLRGPQFDYSWADEAAAWRQIPDSQNMTAWDNLRFATRLATGHKPQICVTTTPKRVDVMRRLLREADEKGTVKVTRGRTKDNLGNLDPSQIEALYGIYGGTRMGRQELEGEMLDDVEGALWTQDKLDDFRSVAMTIGLPLKVVGVDPTVAERPGDECGIVVCAATNERDMYRRQAWVIEDATIMGSPETWAQRVVDTARKWGAPVVAEVNQGGALVRNAIHQIDPGIPVYEVHSKQGKQLRAEPVSLAYEQGRVHHLGILAELETQMTQWIPGEGKSPDRIDALVHALTALMIKSPPGFGSGPIRAKSPAKRRLPIQRGAGARGGRVFTPGRRAA
jgi:phage terminase large subunit-like protein